MEKVYSAVQDNVVAEIIDGEAILIDMTTGCYYSLESTACQVWEWLQAAPVSAASISTRFAAPQPAQLEELKAFLEELVSEKLVICSEGEAASADSSQGLPYSKPVLNKYTDMENLLLMDPIHDVGEQGWPVAPNDGE